MLQKSTRTAPWSVSGLVYCMWKHSSLICPSTEILNRLSGTARLSSEEFIPQKIATLWIASFLLFSARAIFFCSHDWSQISQSMLLTLSRDFERGSVLPLNCWAKLCLFNSICLSCLLLIKVGYVGRKRAPQDAEQTSCGKTLKVGSEKQNKKHTLRCDHPSYRCQILPLF